MTRRAAFGPAILIFGVLWISASAAPAQASVAIHSFAAAPSTAQAGAHPNLEINFEIDFQGSPNTGQPCDCNNAKNIDVSLPAGFIGNPGATPKCSAINFATDTCPTDSQVGVVAPEVSLGGFPPLLIHITHLPVYDLVPKPGQAGLVAWKVPLLSTPIYTVLSARTGGDYGLDALTDGVEQALPVASLEFEMWGVPADPSHDALRYAPGSGPGHPSNSPLTPFLQNPTTCAATLSSTLDVLAYDGGATEAVSPWPTTTGCDQLTFNPSLSAQPTTTETDSPSGLEVDLSVPQTLSAETPSPSEIRATTVQLPEGFSINPGAADGKTFCSDAQARFGTTEEAQCPEISKIGTASILSPALPGALPGAIYIGEPRPGNRYRIILTADGFATHIKLAGTVTPNPANGQLTTSFEGLPQSPLTEINLHLFGSERGLLATPTQCGTYPVNSTFTPWDETLSTQSSTQFFLLDSGPGGSACPGSTRPFNPIFQAASAANAAAAHAPFSIHLTRSDGDQSLSGLSVTTPPGLLATLRGIPYCPEPALEAAAQPSYSGLTEGASPSCPAASGIGTSSAGAGAGTHPVYFPGKVYLAGPYKGAPLSLAVITPAVSGPYDLGNVVVRAALRVDPTTARITAVSDPLPQILQGIPLRLRSLLVNLDRPDFTLNPTDCEPLATAAQLRGSQGTLASPGSTFQVAGCAALPFAPALSLSFKGSHRRTGDPALRAVLTYPKRGAYANIASAAVTLPPTEQIDNAHISSPCTRVQFAANACPAGSVIGTAAAVTPLLDRPLEGPVYLMTGFGHKLPDLFVALKGQIDINLDGHVETVHRRLRTTFASVPDAPVSKFTLSLDGGNKGLLENNSDLCARSLHAAAAFVGQNGKTTGENPALQTPCGRNVRHKHHLNRTKGVR